MRHFLLLCTAILCCVNIHSQTSPLTHALDAEWQFRELESAQWYPANVPGCVHTDLITNKVISHPFFGTNETDCQWVGEKDWIYETKPFGIEDSVLGRSVVRMRFGGLDTYADVYINDKQVLSANNAFRSWEIDVKKLLREKGNVIKIHFYSTLPIAQEHLKSLPYPLPYEGARAVTRKPAYHYGWDWGPKLITCGITKNIEIIAYSEARFTDIYVEQVKVTEKLAQLKTTFRIHSDKDEDCNVLFEMVRNGDNWSSDVHLKKGNNIVELPFEIEYPYRWWCNGQGTPNLYEFNVSLKHGENILDTKAVRTGIRTIKLITEKDSIGESFYFTLNDKPVFIKGANYIPIKYFPGEAKEADYRKLLSSCKEANINMLRVWGGGVYEDEMFYRLCDEMGIMVWQDFMFACAMYPADSLFVSNVIEEVEEQTVRLRNHPCMALWCGNNENAEGWERWGWQQGLTEKQKFQLWRAYKDVFDLTLGKAVKKNTNLDYWESSPRYGRGDARSITEGDSHYWGLWHDEEPFEVLKQKVPRFMSEYGMQSFPSDDVVKEMLTGKDWSYNDPGVLQHQKHNRGFKLMDKYMGAWYPKVSHDSLTRYGYMTQAVQAEGIGMGIEAQRRAMPGCMGTMYWQLNDVWPSFSWSGIDYKGNNKLLHDYLKTVYAPQLISCNVENERLQIYWISDNGLEDDSLLLKFYIYDTTKNADNMQDNQELSAIYTSPETLVNLTYGSHVIMDLGVRNILGSMPLEDLLIEVELSRPGIKVPVYSRSQKLVPKSNSFVIPQRLVAYQEDNKTRKKQELTFIYFDQMKK